jgi:rubrerythrin
MATVKKTLKKDLRDEQMAHDGYHKLAKKLKPKGKMFSRTLLGIAKDEAHHKKLLTKLKKQVAKKSAKKKK